MKLLQFWEDGQIRLGIRIERGVIDAAALGDAAPRTMREAIERGEEGLARLIALLEDESWDAFVRDEQSLSLAPCVSDPQKIICVGLNYRKHAEETGAAIPRYPILFNKFNNALASHGEDIPLPPVSHEVDYEAELCIVIGRRAKDVPRGEALDYVFGYCNANDLSARDLQLRTAQWMLGKTCDKFAPIGPYVVTADEIPDPNNLAISSDVNGETRQRSHTSDMIFRCDEIVSYISRHMTLEPGDLILTGTPEGVVLGLPPERRVYLSRGDVVHVEIEGLGRLENRMKA